MKKILKYRLFERSFLECSIAVPKNSIILSIQEQNNKVYAWAISSEEETEFETKTFKGFMTGREISIEDGMVYRATVKLDGGSFVLHVFEKTSFKRQNYYVA